MTDPVKTAAELFRDYQFAKDNGEHDQARQIWADYLLAAAAEMRKKAEKAA